MRRKTVDQLLNLIVVLGRRIDVANERIELLEERSDRFEQSVIRLLVEGKDGYR